MAIPNISASDQTSQALSTNQRTTANIQPGGINLGAIMQNYAQPYEHGGAEIYQPSRLFDPLFNVEPYSPMGGKPLIATSNSGSSGNIAALVLPLAGAAVIAFMLLK